MPQDYDPDDTFRDSAGVPGVLVAHRAAWDERLDALFRSARAHGLRVLFDIDDLVFEPIAIPWVRALSRLSEAELELYDDGVRRYLRTLTSSDGVLTTTKALASFAAAEGVPAFVHRNGLDIRSLDTARAARRDRGPRDEIVLYYGAGTATHDVDFQECATAIERLILKRSSVNLLVQGDVELGYRFDLVGPRVRRLPWMPWPDYFWGIAQADINLAPLELGNPYSEVKSELKWFEAAVLGIPTVASGTDAFSEVIQSGANGFLARNSSEWFEFLDELAGDPDRRRSLGAIAESEVRSRYTPESMGPELVGLLSRIATADDLTALAKEIGDRAVSPVRSLGESVATDSTHANGHASERPRLTVGWLVPSLPRGGGGARNILRMARHLQSFGHDVTLYVEPTGRERSVKDISDFIEANFPGDSLRVALGFEDVQPSDAVIATFWLTAEALRNVKNCKRKFYLVQDFEPYFYPMGEEYLRAETTYRFGFHHISSGPWCAQHLTDRYGARADHFHFPLDRTIYYPRPITAERPRPRVLFFSRPEMPRRCYNLGVQALARLKARLPEVHITLFGSDEVDVRSLPFACEVVKNIRSLDALAELYSSADAALVLSTTNTSLVPYEAAACGCPVVDLDLDINRVNYGDTDAMLLAPGEPQALADALFSLLDDPELHSRHREAGLRLAETLPNEEQAARRVEEILFQGLGLIPESEESSKRPHSDNGTRGSLDGLSLDVTCRSEDGVLDELAQGKEISQAFSCREAGLGAIAVKVALFGRAIACSLEMSLYEEHVATPLHRIRQSVLELSNDSWVTFRFSPVGDSDGKNYRFVISSPDAKPGNSCGLYYGRHTLHEDSWLRVNGRNGKGALVFQTFVERTATEQVRGLIRPELASILREDVDSNREAGSIVPATTAALQLRDEMRALRKRLERMEQRQTEVTRRVTDLHNFFGAVRASLPYRAARKIARVFRLARR